MTESVEWTPEAVEVGEEVSVRCYATPGEVISRNGKEVVVKINSFEVNTTIDKLSPPVGPEDFAGVSPDDIPDDA